MKYSRNVVTSEEKQLWDMQKVNYQITSTSDPHFVKDLKKVEKIKLKE